MSAQNGKYYYTSVISQCAHILNTVDIFGPLSPHSFSKLKWYRETHKNNQKYEIVSVQCLIK